MGIKRSNSGKYGKKRVSVKSLEMLTCYIRWAQHMQWGQMGLKWAVNNVLMSPANVFANCSYQEFN